MTFQGLILKLSEFWAEAKLDSNILDEQMPEYIDRSKNEKLIPDETFVLVGYCKNNLNIAWYKREGKYNFRMDDDKGSLSLENNVVNIVCLSLT